MFAVAPPESLPAGDVVVYVLGALAVILVMARIVGGIFVRLNQPRIVGEMVAGILIGPTVLGGHLATAANTDAGLPAVDGDGLVNSLYPLQSFSFLEMIGTLTLVLYMFLVGLEVDQKLLRGKGAQIVTVSLAVILVPVGLGFVVGPVLDTPGTWAVEGVSPTTHALIVGAGLAVTAFPVMARILQEKSLMASPMGAVGVGASALVTPLMFLVVAGAEASAAGDDVAVAVGLRLVYAFVFAAVMFAAVRPALAWFIRRRFRADGELDTDLLAVLVIGALAGGVVGDQIGIHSLNGAFIFGAAVPQIDGLGRAIIDKMSVFVVTVMIPVFLAVSGLQTDLRMLEFVLIPGVVLFVSAMVVGKWVAGAAVGRLVGMSWNDANAIGVLLNCRGLMILVAALAGLRAGVLGPAMQICFVIGAIVTTLMTGPLVDRFIPAGAAGPDEPESLTSTRPA